MPKHRLRVSLKAGQAMQFARISIGSEKLVYLILLDKRLRYWYGRSRIAYIGTTGRGVDRVAQSAAALAPTVLKLHGVKSFNVRLVTCRPRQAVKTWLKLERALLLAFRERYGEVPRLNTQGKGLQERDEFELFGRQRLRQIIADLTEEEPGVRKLRRAA